MSHVNTYSSMQQSYLKVKRSLAHFDPPHYKLIGEHRSHDINVYSPYHLWSAFPCRSNGICHKLALYFLASTGLFQYILPVGFYIERSISTIHTRHRCGFLLVCLSSIDNFPKSLDYVAQEQASRWSPWDIGFRCMWLSTATSAFLSTCPRISCQYAQHVRH